MLSAGITSPSHWRLRPMSCVALLLLPWLAAAADSSDSARRPVRIDAQPRLRRAVPPPRLVSELVALSEAAASKPGAACTPGHPGHRCRRCRRFRRHIACVSADAQITAHRTHMTRSSATAHCQPIANRTCSPLTSQPHPLTLTAHQARGAPAQDPHSGRTRSRRARPVRPRRRLPRSSRPAHPNPNPNPNQVRRRPCSRRAARRAAGASS